MIRFRKPGQAGFSLLELSVVLVIAGILVKFGLEGYTAYAEQQYREATSQRMAAIEEALVLFAQRNRRLPCPANGLLAVTNAQYGIEQPNPAVAGDTTNCLAGNEYSVVPWKTLGINPEAANDAWGRRITYRVANGANGLTRNRTAPAGSIDGLNMTECKASATDNTALVNAACPTGSPFRTPLAFLDGKGFNVQDGSGNAMRTPAAPLATGAAFVLISHGKDGRGAYNKNGTKLTDPPAGSLQLANVSHTAAPPVYRLAQLNESSTAGNAFFDDFVLAPTIHSIAVRANLGPN